MQYFYFTVLFLSIFWVPGEFKILNSSSNAATNRIVNGRDGQIEDFPYQLSLRRKSIHICGASVISSSWALTAAHCVYGLERLPDTFTLRMGSSFRSTGGEIIAIRTIHRHPTYNSETMNFDVALLKTNANALRGSHVEAIRLPKIGEEIPDDKPVIVSGWGHMSSANHALSNILKYTTVYAVNQKDCIKSMEDQGGITDAMFCAAAHRTDACQGDSGGPLADKKNNVLLGVVSWGVGCADPNYAGVYTRLAYPAIRRWIQLLTKL